MSPPCRTSVGAVENKVTSYREFDFEVYFFKNSRFLTLPVLIFLVRAFVVLLLALAQADVEFRAAFVPMQVQRHQRIAFALNGAGQPVQFMSIQQQFARSRRVCLDMG